MEGKVLIWWLLLHSDGMHLDKGCVLRCHVEGIGSENILYLRCGSVGGELGVFLKGIAYIACGLGDSKGHSAS